MAEPTSSTSQAGDSLAAKAAAAPEAAATNGTAPPPAGTAAGAAPAATQPSRPAIKQPQHAYQHRTSSDSRMGGTGTGTGNGDNRRASIDENVTIIPNSTNNQPRQRTQRPDRRRSSDSGERHGRPGRASSAVDSSTEGSSRNRPRRRRSSFLSFGERTGGDESRYSNEDGTGPGVSYGNNQGGAGRSSSSKILDDKKTRAVFCLRIITIFMLIVAAVVCATLTWVYVSRDEQDDFTTQYRDSVVKVAEAFQRGIDVKTSASSTFSAVYTSRYGPADTWPNVTMPDFAQQAAGQLDLADGRALSFNPIITDETKAGWEAFADDSKDILGADPAKVAHVSNGIFGKDPPASGSRYPDVYVPVWQIAPIETNERAVMFNLHSERDRMRALDDVLQYKVPALTAMLQLVQDGTDTRPSSILFYPVFDTFAEVDDAEGHDVVGTISIVFSWDVVLASVLPAYIRGIVCVIESNSGDEGEAFTYSITGDTATLLGGGDLHDPKYDDQRYTVTADLAGTSERLDVVDFLITYKLSMYPSDEMRDQYITNKPALYTMGVVLIFVLTSGIFLLYDYLVEHRQSKVMRAAVQTSRIVDTMFPAVVRDRLFNNPDHARGGAGGDAVGPGDPGGGIEGGIRRISGDASAAGGGGSRKKSRVRRLSTMVDPTARMKQFLGGGGGSNSKLNSKADNPDFNVPAAIKAGGNLSAPIADLFPNTSIMFCDIVGFTAWSSNHEPNEVFTLLETLFWEFDELAKLYDVFKLGTIGDCYIAVTGLPDPQEDHASLLAEFAEECRRKMNEVNESLEHHLDGSSGLSMRFGIHSGPVTAGVLRGQKSRFELFGDTINTASRMESTGTANRIQVSGETADLLREDGREDWLVPREGLVKAKGKGDLQTYWLNVVLPGDADYAEVGDYMSQSVASNSISNSRHHFYREASDLSSTFAENSTTAATRGGGGRDVVAADVETGDATASLANASVSTDGGPANDDACTQACTEDGTSTVYDSGSTIGVHGHGEYSAAA